MKLLTFSGTYSYRKQESFSGFICFCHFEKKDSEQKIERIANEILQKSDGQKIGLVPFSHLDEDVMPIEDARHLFNVLVDRVGLIGEGVSFVAPFAVTKELNLNVPADDSAVRFFHF